MMTNNKNNKNGCSKSSIYIPECSQSLHQMKQKDDMNNDDDDDHDQSLKPFCPVTLCIDDSNVESNHYQLRMKRCSQSFYNTCTYADTFDDKFDDDEDDDDTSSQYFAQQTDNEAENDENDEDVADVQTNYNKTDVVINDGRQGSNDTIITLRKIRLLDSCLIEQQTASNNGSSSSDKLTKQRQRRMRLLQTPSRVDFRRDRQSIMAAKQNALNNFVLREAKATNVNRTDHHIMLRQLVSEAYFHDPQRRLHRPQWRKIIVAVRKEYWGAKAIFSLSPDPYQDVLAKLSSMMLWNDNHRHWTYTYCADQVRLRHARQSAILNELHRSKKLFLS